MELISDSVDKINTLKNRELERKLNLQKKQETKKSFMAENEQMEFFQRTFNEKQNYIESLLKKSQTLSKEELPEHFNTISKEILMLQKYVAASNLFLRNYFLQKCQNVLQELSLRAQELENDLLPKKKFGFKNKAKGNDVAKGADTIDFALKAATNGNVKTLKENSLGIECGFHKRSNETLSLSAEEIAKKDVCLEHLTNCTVYLKGYPSTLHLNHLSDCKIFSGPVSTSIFAENCFNSTLVIACQQLRLHASTKVDIYLHVTSRAIMEDCNNIAIAPYNWSYDTLDTDFVNAGLDKEINNWRCVDDFNWLNAEMHSPNWREMEEEKRVKEWT
ncbi:tubulin-specific chaperone C [Anthonomus grandis grandis]|uniref:tubulin-specific chaperone C n=1 Tax=Anthonomus grandis grandis TaxID=2921223 RepID=UPI002165DC53|nr:tubulin-specific chaperone C [Anthonomus grandis grandis]